MTELELSQSLSHSSQPEAPQQRHVSSRSPPSCAYSNCGEVYKGVKCTRSNACGQQPSSLCQWWARAQPAVGWIPTSARRVHASV